MGSVGHSIMGIDDMVHFGINLILGKVRIDRKLAVKLEEPVSNEFSIIGKRNYTI